MLSTKLPKALRFSLPSFVLLALTALLLSACVAPVSPATTGEAAPVATESAPASEAATALFPVTVTDAAGQEFTFDAPPKIGCGFFGCYETLSDLGVTAQASSAGNPADRGANYYTPGPEPIHLIDDFANPELWAAAETDLIVLAAPPEPSTSALEQAAPLFYIYYTAAEGTNAEGTTPIGLEAFIKNLELLGQITGQPEAAAAALARYENALEKLRALATPETAQLKVALIRSRDTYQIFGDDTAFCTVILEVGLGQCLGEGDFITELNAEELLALDPDWIIYVTNNDSYKDRTDPVWLELQAVKEGRVYDTVTNRYGCCSVRALYQPLIEYINHVLPEAGAPEQLSTADFVPEDNWLVNP